MRAPSQIVAAAVFAVLPWCAPCPSCAGWFAQPAVTPAQVEADWIRADTLRHRAEGGAVSPARDAAGGCDGVRNGEFGFHTALEDQPWWQVDLGRPVAVDRVVLFNRRGFEGRTARVRVLLSTDGGDWQTAYAHDGAPFGGSYDGRPLCAPLNGATGRFVRLRIPQTDYLHFDEVEVYAIGVSTNIALGRHATQSSVSQWSVAHDPPAAMPWREFTRAGVERGRRLAADLTRRGVDVRTALAFLGRVESRLETTAGEEAQRRLYLDARWAVRRMALANPLLDFDAILFAKTAPGRFPHVSDQYYGWWSRPGGGLFILQGFRGDRPTVRPLSADWPAGTFLRPQLSYDGRRAVFAYGRFHPEVADLRDKMTKSHLPEDAFFHIFEMDLAKGTSRQLTRGRYDDVDPCYLPDGDIAFISTRKGPALQNTRETAAATLHADLPDSYVRCGGDRYRPVPVFTLHRMDRDGDHLRPISSFETFEYAPSVADDGCILYTRWDYIDRFNGHFFSLWSTHPDGTNPQLVYGNYTVKPQVVIDARSIPRSRRLMFTAAAHHSITGGSLCLLDRARGTEGPEPLERLTPEVPFPEAEAWPDTYYANPWPLAEEHWLAAWSDRRLPPHGRVDDRERNPPNATGLYLCDAFGNLNLLYRDPAISSACPIPLRPRPTPPVMADSGGPARSSVGCFALADVYRGLDGVPRGAVKRLRIVGVPPKPQPHMNQPSIGVSAEDPGKYVIGTVPVETDGSACFRVPVGTPVFFQVLDAGGLAIQTMRSLTYVQSGQTLSCVGCHESRETAPPAVRRMRALARMPSRPDPGPDGSWPLRFDRLVQPVLDRHCVSCHSPSGATATAAAIDLTADQAYATLLTVCDKDLQNRAFERDRSVPGECTARGSRLFAHLAATVSTNGHGGVRLTAAEMERLVTWMDLYAQKAGHYSEEQERQIEAFRRTFEGWMAADQPLAPGASR